MNAVLETSSATLTAHSELFLKVQRLSMATILYAHRCMKHTVPALINHHTMLLCDASAHPWRVAVLVTLWKKQIADFIALDELLLIGNPHTPSSMPNSRGNSPLGDGGVVSSSLEPSLPPLPTNRGLVVVDAPPPSSGLYEAKHLPIASPLMLLLQTTISLLSQVLATDPNSKV